MKGENAWTAYKPTLSLLPVLTLVSCRWKWARRWGPRPLVFCLSWDRYLRLSRDRDVMVCVCAVKTPGPLKNRDFVTQRIWLDLGKEMMIFNHSVNHTVYSDVMLLVQEWADFSTRGGHMERFFTISTGLHHYKMAAGSHCYLIRHFIFSVLKTKWLLSRKELTKPHENVLGLHPMGCSLPAYAQCNSVQFLYFCEGNSKELKIEGITNVWC